LYYCLLFTSSYYFSRCMLLFSFLFSMLPPPPRSTLFPYTTLFRSSAAVTSTAKSSQRSLAKSGDWNSSQLVSLVLLLTVRITNRDRKSTRLNSSHVAISYAVFCLKKKKKKQENIK